MPGLGTSFGRGGATTALPDLANADAVLIMGSSMAEQHPVGFRFVMQARERGAKLIHVDPRFTRTSAMADLWVPLRAGSDIVFLGALINYVLTNGREFHEYVARFTNAPTIIGEDFKDTEDLAGFFSGWQADKKEYNPESWIYEGARIKPESVQRFHENKAAAGHAKERGGEEARLNDPQVESDPTLQHPRCVFQLLKEHFARYTPELVERACGLARDEFLRVADAYTSASGPDKTGVICYAVGWTQHSTGVQIIRSAAILQLLLGNVGRPGGGVMALRGHASIQGSTDIPTLYDILPGYLPMPFFGSDGKSLEHYNKMHTPNAGWWSNFPKYSVSLLKAYYGEHATKENEFGFQWLPRVTGDHSHFGYWLEMDEGKLEGLFVMGQNPAVGAGNSGLQRKALTKLKWLVVRDLVETETAAFWYSPPDVERGLWRPEDVGTEVFLMPAASHVEKNGTFTNTQRMLQWHEKAVDPPGDARSEPWFIYHLGRRLREKARQAGGRRNEPLNSIFWDYQLEGIHHEPVVEELLKEVNGWTVADHKLVDSYTDLKDDGSTACGCWIYSGVFAGDVNHAAQREPRGPYGHGWGFAWPSDRRILYNRSSARPGDGQPWSERKKLVWWDEAKGEWGGLDVPDFGVKKRPDYKPPKDAFGEKATAGDAPFTLHPDGRGWIWVASGLKDGPLPTHFEPLESPFRNPLYPQATNPPVDWKKRPDNPYASSPDPRYPFILTTYRLTEHHTAGGMSRTLSHLAELQPELFCEISPELATERRISHGGWVTITTPRSQIQAKAMVTARMPSLTVEGRRVHQVGLPYHWGFLGLVKGDIANDLLAVSEEPNVRINETKALLCDVQPGLVVRRQIKL